MILKHLFLILCTASLSFGASISELRPEIQAAAQRNGVDAALLEAILRHESANGQSRAARNYNNLGGVMQKSKLRKFTSKEESVESVAFILSRYKAKGLVNIDQIARRYAPYHRSEWVRCVGYFKKKIESGTI